VGTPAACTSCRSSAASQERRAALKFDAAVYTCNYDNLPWLVEHYGERWPFSTVSRRVDAALRGSV
jgi:hypothetical protein